MSSPEPTPIPKANPRHARIDLSFSAYVNARKGVAAARAREGAAYAYAGDLKVRQTLGKIRPVTLAVEAAVRFWQTVEKGRMLGTAVRVTDKQFPNLHKLAARCAETLQIATPSLYVSPGIGSVNAHTFGTTDDAYIVLNAGLIDQLSDLELLDVIGHECGHIQNDHAVYLTTLYFLNHTGALVLRWGAKPAVLALKAWARRAQITCDRAALLCTRDVDVSIGCLVKLALGSQKLFSAVNVDDYLKQMEEARGPGRLDELSHAHPYLPKRVAALRLFAQTTYFKSLVKGNTDAEPIGGISKEECDARVADLLTVFR
ncbi:MAG: M48 family metallopeptidase [Deltaproteobacteria bacterium]|nr:M48 family metallopeptidase [Deltaproteobacteria bacterium]